MKKVWFCEKGKRCVFIICEMTFSNGKRARAGRAISLTEWHLYTPEYQTVLFEHQVRVVDYDITQIGAL